MSTTSAHSTGHQEPLLPWAPLTVRMGGLGISVLSFSSLKLEVVSIFFKSNHKRLGGEDVETTGMLQWKGLDVWRSLPAVWL